MKVFLDANILFSASAIDSATRMLLDLVAQRGEIVTNPHAWEEARRNLAAKRPKCLSGLEALESRIAITHAFRLPNAVNLQEKDRPILAGAIGAECSHLWTSDRMHFGAFYGQTIVGVKIVSSLLLADEIGL